MRKVKSFRAWGISMRSTGRWSRGICVTGARAASPSFRAQHTGTCKNNGHFQTGISNTTNHLRMVKPTEFHATGWAITGVSAGLDDQTNRTQCWLCHSTAHFLGMAYTVFIWDKRKHLIKKSINQFLNSYKNQNTK